MSLRQFHEFPDGSSINFIGTDEGIIIDLYDYRGEPIGTVGMTYDEWFEWAMNRSVR